MRNFLITCIMALVSVIYVQAMVVYVPGNAGYEALENSGDYKTIQEVLDRYGYKDGQTYLYFNFESPDKDIDCVVFKFFTDNVLFVFASKPLSNPNVAIKNYLNKYNFKEAQSASEIMSHLDYYIEKGGFTKEFVCEALGLDYNKFKDSNAVMDVNNGLVYNFKDGIMVSYASSDGLNEGAKWLKNKNPKAFDMYLAYLRDYYDNEEDVLEELNKQMECMYEMDVKYADVIRMPNTLLNFYVGWLMTTGASVPIEEFKRYTHNKANRVSFTKIDGKDFETYEYLDTLFEFEDGKLKVIHH